MPRIVLASSSPRRRELLASLRLTFEIRHADVDESVLQGEDPFEAAERLARAKAAAIGENGDALVIAADPLVVVEGEALGKPRDPEDARRRLRRVAGAAEG